MMKPYFYKIRDKETNQIYVGSQYGKNANPENFWVTYFTSSKRVRLKSPECYEIELVEQRDDAREYEANYLKESFMSLGKEKFFEMFINRNIAPGILNDTETIQKANIKRKISNSVAAKKRVEQGTHNFLGMTGDSNIARTSEERLKRSKRMKGNNFGSLREMTEELRQKLAEKSKGNTNVRGTIWVKNKEGKRKRVQPDNIPEGYSK